MIWLLAIGLGLLALGAGGGRTFGPRPGLAKIQIPSGTKFVLWIDDARSAAVYRKDNQLFAQIRNGEMETIGPLSDGREVNEAIGAAEFDKSPVRYERIDGKRTWAVLPVTDGWHWVASVGPTVISGASSTRSAAISDAWSAVEEVA